MASSSSAPRAETVDFGRCFRFVVDDPDWLKKVLIGGAFTLASVLIVGLFFVAGYWVRLLKRVAAGEARPLPEWDDLGDIFKEGLPVMGVYFAHVFGVLLIVASFGCLGGLVAFAMGGLGSGSHRAADAIGALGALGFAGLYVVLILVGLALSLYLPAAFVRVALSGRVRGRLRLAPRTSSSSAPTSQTTRSASSSTSSRISWRSSASCSAAWGCSPARSGRISSSATPSARRCARTRSRSRSRGLTGVRAA